MALAIPLPLAFGRFKQLPQRSNEVWQGALVRVPAWVDHPTDPDGEPFRPVGALWVSLRTELLHLALPDDGAHATPEFALAALIEFGLKWAKGLEGRPARVEVQDATLRDALLDPLSRLATSVVLVDDTPAVRDALRHLEMEAGGGRRFPGVLEAPDITSDRLWAFADAAARFYKARVWEHLANVDLIVAKGPRVVRGMAHVSVLGNGGQEFGLAFFESRKAFERLIDPASNPTRHADRAHGVTFGPIDDLPFGDVDAWQDYELPVAGKKAYPLVADLGADGSMRRPDARELTHIEALLRALAETTEEEFDAGRWERRVQTFDGPVALTLALPFLIEAEEECRPPGASAGRELTALERAQELALDARDAEGRLQAKRVRQALALSPDCADAWVILGDSASTPEVALERYERGVEAGARAIGAERFAALEGEFWGQLDTRPYMRARLALAQTLWGLGREEDALGHYRELLRLNRGDDQGVRYLLVAALLEFTRDEEAGVVLDLFEGDAHALWPYARLLWRFRSEGDSARTRAALDDAFRANPHAVAYLLNPDLTPFGPASSFALGSKDEAAYVAEMLGDAFDATPGAAPWLRSQTAKRRVRARTPRHPRR